eukprot:PhF_6_TR28133/c0_g1_i1/m.41634
MLRKCSVTYFRIGMKHNRHHHSPSVVPLPLSTSPASWLSDLTLLHSAPDIFGCATLDEAWRSLNVSLAVMEDTEKHKMIRSSYLPALAEASVEAEFNTLLSVLPADARRVISTHPAIQSSNVTEIFVHVGQSVIVHTYGGTPYPLMGVIPTQSDIIEMFHKMSSIGVDRRACIPGTLHRVGVYSGRGGNPVGCTIRVGRYIPGVGRGIVDLIKHGSVLIVSPPGCGKTTLLRDIVSSLSRERDAPRTVVIDTSNEICGDGDSIASYFGGTRRLQVPRRDDQLSIMLQGVQNHTPEILVVDEISNDSEADAVCSMCHRGVRVLCTVHGSSLASISRNMSLNKLIGGCTPAFLSADEKRAKRKERKTILERTNPCPFTYVVELGGGRSVSTDSTPTQSEGEGGSGGDALLYSDLDTTLDVIFDKEDWKVGGRDLAKPVDLQRRMKNL